MMTPLVKMDQVSKLFKVGKKNLHALEKVDLQIYKGEILALVGESGSGKSTVGRILLKLLNPSSGDIYFDSLNLSYLSNKAMKPLRRRMQMVFQDPYSSLNPRMTIHEILSEPFIIHKLLPKREILSKVEELMSLVGLNPKFSHRFSHEFSGGQRQRIGIARALAVNPEFLVCDEPVSALDVSIQAQLINLLKKLQNERALTYLFISHDLALVNYISDRVAVLYLGKILEVAPTEQLYKTPLHPYTQALLSSIPHPEPQSEKKVRILLKGEIPNLFEKSQGCPFASRCPIVQPLCREITPLLREISPGHSVACHLVS